MLKVSLTQPDGASVVFLGLTGKDLEQLQSRQTLALSMEEVGLTTGRAFLLFRPTLQELHDDLKSAGLPVSDLPRP